MLQSFTVQYNYRKISLCLIITDYDVWNIGADF